MSAPRPRISAVILCVVLAQVAREGFAEEPQQRSQLQLINGSNHSVAGDDRERLATVHYRLE